MCTLGVGGEARYFCRVADAERLRGALEWARGADLAGPRARRRQQRRVRRRRVRRSRDRRRHSRCAVGAPTRIESGSARGRESRGIRFVATTVAAECAGLECLSGIPGQVGGTPVQNVGAYGQDVSGTITRVEAVNRETLEVVQFSNAECDFGYRTSRFKRRDLNRFVVTQVEFELKRGWRSHGAVSGCRHLLRAGW